MDFWFDKIKNRVAKWSNDQNRVNDSDLIFSLSSSHVTLDMKMGLVTTGRCALVTKANSGQYFRETEQEVKRFLDSIEREGSSTVELHHDTITDHQDYLWIVLYGKRIEDLLVGLTAIGDLFTERGFSNQILAAVFQFYNENDNDQSSFIVYDYKLNKFYPFVPVSHKRKIRNNAEEMKIMEIIAEEIPFEKDKDLWRPLWNLPL
ncbi:MAG: PspA-associated protein PspAB [Nitrososphaera sp.]